MSEKSVPKMHSRRLRPVFQFVVIVLFYCLSGGVLDIAAAADTSQGSPEQINIVLSERRPLVNRHQPIKPSLYHGVHRTPLESTLEQNGQHVSHLTMTYHAEKRKEVILDLRLNQELLPKGHFVHYQLPDGGGYALKNFTLQDVDHCHYVGKIRGNEESTAAISTCDNAINGVVFDGTETYYVHAATAGNLVADTADHYLMRHSDLDFTNKTCGYQGTHESHGHSHSEENQHTEFNRILRYKRSSDEPKIRGPYNANRDSSFVELILVVDNKLYQAMDGSLRRVHNHCKTISNIINAVYTPLNIFIALIGVVVWSENNEVELSSDGDKTLKNFLHYRRKTLVKTFPNDNAQLLTREQFDGGVVGKALKGPICTYEFSGGVSMDHSQIVAVVATTVAHEIGHNFGMEHDTADCKCEDDRCIMSASSSSVAPKHWSSCSIDQLNLAFHQGMNYCLRNKPKSLFDSPQCGNGFVEPGEQCDCGLPRFCTNSCCDPYTCMLFKNASCATGECCDLATCRPRRAGTLCRNVNGECDLPEYCEGESEYCPTDVFKRDTEVCGRGRAYCYEGSCRSRTDQCRVLWGISGNSSDECYTKNENASRHGNCGYDRVANEYVKCRPEDIYCGMLHCRHTNEKLEFGMENVAVLSHSFLNHENRIVACRTAIVDLGLESTDPGLTPNGAKCGEGRMCVNQRCLAIDQVMAAGKGTRCEGDCNGHGVCNSNGNCHCDAGFAPPNCVDPGPGGSIESGPAADPNVGEGFAMFLIIFFGMILPLAGLAFCILWCRKNNPDKAFVFKRPFNMPRPLIKFGSSSKSSSPMSGSTNLSNGPGKSLPTSPDDMNASLLRPSNDEALLNNTMFGKFKGFTMRPLQDTPASTATSPLGPNVAFVQPVSKATEPGKAATATTTSPSRAAPAVPKVPKVGRSQSSTQPKEKSAVANIHRTRTIGGVNALGKSEDQAAAAANEPPALPPLNPGSHPRPLISSPILESSTSTAKEMLSPLKHGKQVVPVRPAPKVESTFPPPPIASLDSPEVDFAVKPLPPLESKGSTLQRIKSFMRKDEKPVSAAPPLVVSPTAALAVSPAKQFERKVPKFIDRNRLKTIEISAPIPQLETQTEISNRKSILARTHSMRKESPADVEAATAATQQQLLSFGSTRSMRPKSVVTSRPKSPPPPRPPVPNVLISPPAIKKTIAPPPASSVSPSSINPIDSYERPPAPKRVGFVDLPVKVPSSSGAAPLASEDSSPASPDNIYAVIDEHRRESEDLKSQAGDTSMESLGLLGEIVNEIENRNVQSIYSAGGLKRSPSQEEGEGPRYANTEDVEEGNNAPFSHLKSNGGTSSGYLKPATAMPVARVAPTKPTIAAMGKPMTSFKDQTKLNAKADGGASKEPYKPYHASINRPFASQYSVPKAKVSSVAGNAVVAGAAVHEGKANKPQTPVKPVIKAASSASAKQQPPTSGKTLNRAASAGAAKTLSNVAKMQQKFETADKK